MVLLGWLLGLQNARGPMALLIVDQCASTSRSLCSSCWASAGRCPGVAAATVCAEYGGLALGLWLARRQLRGLAGSWRWPSVLDAGAFRRLLAVNRDIMLRSLSLEAAFLGFTALSSRRGEVVLAANAVLLNFLTFAAFGLDGFAHAAEAMVGRHVGRGDAAGFRAATRANLMLRARARPGPGAGLRRGGSDGDRPDDRARRGARHGRHLSAVCRRPAAGRGVRLSVRRRVHRRDPHRRDAQRHGARARRVPAARWRCWRRRSATTACGWAMLLFMAARGVWLGACYLYIARGRGFVVARTPGKPT